VDDGGARTRPRAAWMAAGVARRSVAARAMVRSPLRNYGNREGDAETGVRIPAAARFRLERARGGSDPDRFRAPAAQQESTGIKR
jgi:hypothetical protein